MNEVSVPKVGDVLVASWGYDQTNIDFYQVVRATKASVWLQPMSQEIVKAGGFMSEYVVPKAPIFVQRVRDYSSEVEPFKEVEVKPEMFRWNKYGYAKVSYSAYAQPYDGKPKYQSHYA